MGRFSSDAEVWTYSENTGPNSSWEPTISGIAANGGNFILSGTQLNGISEGASYGDDAQMATDYPMIQLTSGSGMVSYAETSNWSLPGTVQTGNTSMSTDFAAPASTARISCRSAPMASPPATFSSSTWGGQHHAPPRSLQ